MFQLILYADPIHYINVGLAVIAFAFAMFNIHRARPPYRWMKAVLAVDALLLGGAHLIHILYGDNFLLGDDVADLWVLATFIGAIWIGIGRRYDR